MIEVKRTNSDNEDFVTLVKLLDEYLVVADGSDYFFYSRFNKLEKIKHVVVAYENGKPTGCGAIKEFAPNVFEIKRMYTSPDCRGKGIATKILSELEKWATELACERCVLETGKRQPEAIGLYNKNGYKIIPNYGQYSNMENSVCFEKEMK